MDKKYALNSFQMKEIDTFTIEQIGIPSMVLMEKAAMSVVKYVKRLCEKQNKILAVCGYGNNGGDGVAVARMLHMEGYLVDILMVGEEHRATKETRQQLKIAENLGVSILRKVQWAEYTIIVDAIFGIGLTREVTGEFKKTIEEINCAKKIVVSVDIPSGVSADNGKVLGIAVKAHTTVTFGWNKVGCLLFPGANYAGTIYIEEIGFATKEEELSKRFYFDKKPEHLFPVRKADSNKGTYGKVLIIAGCKDMSGATYFAAKAAYRMGAGLVRIITAAENREILQYQLPEAILTTYTTKEELTKQEEASIEEAIQWANVILIGPGLGRSNISALLVQMVLKSCQVPLVIDADGLNMIATMISEQVVEKTDVNVRIECLAKLLPKGTIITPHKKELSRLTGIPLENLVNCLIDSSSMCTYNNEIIYVKKDARTIVSFGSLDYINVTGNDGMATAGSGDVLGGIIVGLLAQGTIPFVAAVLGVYLHGLAGDIASRQKGTRSLIASDILEAIPETLK